MEGCHAQMLDNIATILSGARIRSGVRIALHRIGFSGIVLGCVAGDFGHKDRTEIQDVEHYMQAQLMLVWIEASVSLYSYMRKGPIRGVITGLLEV